LIGNREIGFANRFGLSTAHPVFHQRESRELLSRVFDRIKFFDILPRDSRHREAPNFAASLIFERLQSMRPDPGTPFGQTNGRTLIDYFETRAGLEAETWCGANPAIGPQGLGHGLELPPRRLAEVVLRDLLQSVAESPISAGQRPSMRSSPRPVMSSFRCVRRYSAACRFPENDAKEAAPDSRSRASASRPRSTW
jgi:hypothetical protein